MEKTTVAIHKILAMKHILRSLSSPVNVRRTLSSYGHSLCRCHHEKSLYNPLNMHQHMSYSSGSLRYPLRINLQNVPLKTAETVATDSQTASRELNQMEEKTLFPQPEFNWQFLVNPVNKEMIEQNILNRKGVGDIYKVHELLNSCQDLLGPNRDIGSFLSEQQSKVDPARLSQDLGPDLNRLKDELSTAALDLPNLSHPDAPIGDESCAVELHSVGTKKEYAFEPKTVVELGEHLHCLRLRDTTVTTGPRTYYLERAFAMLEQALIRYTIQALLHQGVKMMSVPDLIYPEIMEGCGFKTTGERNQVYKLDPKKFGLVCLAGTGEMPLAGFCMNHTFQHDQLPQRLMAVSRCYRAETSSVAEHQGIYRVHQFTKVEMFTVTADDTGTESQTAVEEIIRIQEELFKPLGLTFRVLDMPSHEMGAPASRKYDLEAWMSGKSFWGEISSASNCTDYQSRRLAIKYWDSSGKLKHCHTVNGTGCAIPRMIMAIAETNQQQDMSIQIPEVLQPYMGGLTAITVPSEVLNMKPIKLSNSFKKAMKNS